jgi:hypothetical protein
VARYTEGFSHFVTSMTAPVASGWSGCRVGLAPTGKRRLSRRTPSADIRPSRRERLFIPLLASFIVDNPIGSSSEKPPFANRDQRLNGARLI